MIQAFNNLSPQVKHVVVIVVFLVVYCILPLLIDTVKHQGAAHPSTFLILLPHYYSMVLVGFLPTEEGKSVWQYDWRKGVFVSSLDIVNQLLKKAGLIFAGSGVYIVIDSSSIVWTALWSRYLLERRLSWAQWSGILLISGGIAVKAANLDFFKKPHEFYGVILILIASILMGLTFVLNEKYMKGADSIPGPLLVCMMGTCCSIVLTLWTVGYTIPNIGKVWYDPIAAHNGSYTTIAIGYFLLLFFGWVHSGTLWFLLHSLGAVTSGVLKGLKVAIVFCLSHYFFCEKEATQCLTVLTSVSAIVCVVGVVIYSIATKKGGHGHGHAAPVETKTA